MTQTALTFALEVRPYDVDPTSDNDEVFWAPCLTAYSDATLAAALNEGINIWEPAMKQRTLRLLSKLFIAGLIVFVVGYVVCWWLVGI